ncbi:MAG: TIR domain-containing protein [Hyphomonadaceae bacterium]
MPDIFLSYNREDQAKARLFADAFAAEGFHVWWDTTLRAGEAYDEVTEQALRQAGAVVVLWSRKSVASRWVRAEATVAHRQKTLVPAMIEACERPIMFELTQTAELGHWAGDRTDPAWRAFLADVRQHLAQSPHGAQGAGPSLRRDQSALPEVYLAAKSKQGLSRRTLIGSGAAGVILAGTGVIWWLNLPGQHGVAMGSAGGEDNRVAVLPFLNISGDPGQDYFADGLSAEVRAELARNSALQVAAQTSSSVFKERAQSAKEMADKLGVAYLLDGNARKADSLVRVNAELIDGKTGFSLWAQTFERPIDNVFAVQSEIAASVTTALVDRVARQASDKARPAKTATTSPGGTQDVAAFEHKLKGRALFESALGGQTDLDALAEFDAALALDPDYAAAHAWRSRTLSVLYGQSVSPNAAEETRLDAIAAGRKAVSLASDFADGYSALGFALFNVGLDVKAAKPVFEQSLNYGRGDGDVLTGFAVFCARTGRVDEAVATIARATTLDPLNPTVFRSAGTIALLARRYREALPFFERALSMNPKMSVAHSFQGTALLLMDRHNEARQAFEAEPNQVFALPGLAILDHLAGQKAAAQANLDKLIRAAGDSGLYQQAQVFAMWGELDRAVAQLERAFQVKDAGLANLFTDPLLDKLKGHAAYQRLVKVIGFV